MEAYVELLGFGEPGYARLVPIPEDKIVSLQNVFLYGQNHVQPQDGCRSISVGDIIQLNECYWLIKPLGFSCLSTQQYKAYKAMGLTERTLFALGSYEEDN